MIFHLIIKINYYYENKNYFTRCHWFYAVDITTNSCTERLDCMNITLSVMSDNLLNYQVKIYHNPVSDKLIIENKIPVHIEISDLNGRRVCILNLKENQKIFLDMLGFSKGIYFVKFVVVQEFTKIK